MAREMVTIFCSLSRWSKTGQTASEATLDANLRALLTFVYNSILEKASAVCW